VSGVGVTGSAVFVSSSGQLGVRVFSVRFKDEIKPMDKASEAILALKPVTFHYRKEIDPDRTPQFGLVAEEVEKVNRDLVTKWMAGQRIALSLPLSRGDFGLLLALRQPERLPYKIFGCFRVIRGLIICPVLFR
jgi:hypothetical protein